MEPICTGSPESMWNAVRERTREVGTLRAIGMRRYQVLLMFMLEALVLGLVSTGAGAITGALLCVGLNSLRIGIPIDALKTILLSNELHLAVEPASLIEAVLALTLLTSLAALFVYQITPLYRAEAHLVIDGGRQKVAGVESVVQGLQTDRGRRVGRNVRIASGM